MGSVDLKSILIWAATALQRVIMPLGLRPARYIAGNRFFFDPATDIGLQLLITGRFEEGAIAQCANFIRPDGIVIDVGANIGFHAVHFAQLVGLGKVICFEPARSTFAYLLRNVERVPNVIPLNIALSDATGLQNFFVAADDAYSGLKDTKRKTILRQESIACFTGDEILTPLIGGQRIDLVKVDVEGFETEVLHGMRKLLSAHRPVVFCEIFGGKQSNPDPEETVRFCVSLGYDAFVLNGKQLVAAGAHDDKFYNYFFIPKKQSWACT
jgi:FkbM family methyltransferase